ncbi:MAG: hypothetical protein QME78_11975 [Thermodesulfobacteriota bacterium]|nr:hypothetical protein [Thermodesulfobacteriota bacterium]
MKKIRIWGIPIFLVCFLLRISSPWGASPAEGKTISFPEVSGWRQPEKPQVFSPESLYEYINGAADLYLKYDFQDLQVAEYVNEKKAAVTVEVYRHRTPTHAFGIYSQERLANADFLDIGAQGYSESMVLNFFRGVYYVKISSYNTGAEDQKIRTAFARKVDQVLDGQATFPAILSSFPSEGKKKNTEKFIAKDFLGYSFLDSGFTADYEIAGKKFKIFAIEGRSEKDCRDMVEKYLKNTGNVEKKLAEGLYRVKDPYHGMIDLFWTGRYIWGIIDLDVPDLRSRYLKHFEGLSKK